MSARRLALLGTIALGLVVAPLAGAQAAQPTCTIVDLSFTETDATVLHGWQLQCSNPTATTESATYQSFDATAKSPGDYVSFSGTITVPPGLSTRGVTIDVVGDDVGEPTDLFSIRFDDPEGVIKFRDSTGTAEKTLSIVEIVDDDGFTVRSISRSVPEGDLDPTSVDIEVTLSDPVDRPFDVTFYTQGGTAEPGSDYEFTNVTLTFQPGDVSKTTPVIVLPDGVDESDETIGLGLGIQGSATLQGGFLTIVDDDEASTAPCILLSESAISVSGPASTPTQRGFAEVKRITMTNCGSADVNVHARGTDATGGGATWELTNLSSGGPIDSVCELGLDTFRTNLTLWNPAGGGVGTSLTNADRALLGLDGLNPFVFGPEDEQEISADVELPCEDSSGIGQPMSMDVVLTAVEP